MAVRKRKGEIRAFIAPTSDNCWASITRASHPSRAERVDPFKMPRFIQYVFEFPFRASGKIAKHLLSGSPPVEPTKVIDAERSAWIS